MAAAEARPRTIIESQPLIMIKNASSEILRICEMNYDTICEKRGIGEYTQLEQGVKTP